MSISSFKIHPLCIMISTTHYNCIDNDIHYIYIWQIYPICSYTIIQSYYISRFMVWHSWWHRFHHVLADLTQRYPRWLFEVETLQRLQPGELPAPLNLVTGKLEDPGTQGPGECGLGGSLIIVWYKIYIYIYILLYIVVCYYSVYIYRWDIVL